MVIIQHYILEQKGDSPFFYVKSQEESHCPYCGGKFKVIGSRRRILYKQDGSCIFLVVRRLRCLDCEKISHELPDVVVPYKRHESDAIAYGLTEDVPPEIDCCMAEYSTISRWKHWLFYNRLFFEESLRIIQTQTNHISFPHLPLSPLNRQPKDWLRLLVYHLVNTGFWEHTRLA